MKLLLVFDPTSFIRSLTSAPNTVTKSGKTYHGLLSFPKNGQVLSQFYVSFKGPIVKLVEDWLVALIPYAAKKNFAIIRTAITYLQKGATVYKNGTTISNVGGGIVNIYHGTINTGFVFVDLLLVGQYVPVNTSLAYKWNATKDFLDLIQQEGLKK